MGGQHNLTAFPISPEIWATHPDFHGMTLRDWFAGQALAGLLATNQDYHDDSSDGWDWHAKAAYSMADAMLAARTGAPA